MMTTSPRSQIIAVSDLGWQEYRPGISFKLLWQDPATKRRAQMTHFAPGATLPLHRHVGDELIFVIEGAISDESGTVTAGKAGSGMLPSTPTRYADKAGLEEVATQPEPGALDAPQLGPLILIVWPKATPSIGMSTFCTRFERS